MGSHAGQGRTIGALALGVALSGACSAQGYFLDVDQVGGVPAGDAGRGPLEGAAISSEGDDGVGTSSGSVSSGSVSGGSVSGGGDDGASGGSGADAASPDAVAPAGDASGVQILIQPGAPTICRGQCVTLEAEIYGAEPPYAYEWEDVDTLTPLGVDGGALRVCPDSTTQYLLVALVTEDAIVQYTTAGSAGATVTVVDCDGGASAADASVGPGTPTP
jgi:hypothetical protein